MEIVNEWHLFCLRYLLNEKGAIVLFKHRAYLDSFTVRVKNKVFYFINIISICQTQAFKIATLKIKM